MVLENRVGRHEMSRGDRYLAIKSWLVYADLGALCAACSDNRLSAWENGAR